VSFFKFLIFSLPPQCPSQAEDGRGLMEQSLYKLGLQ
jgi:hypothetical protein